jgi:hypothetical protein
MSQEASELLMYVTGDDVHLSGRGALLHDARGREGERALVTLPVCSPPTPARERDDREDAEVGLGTADERVVVLGRV